MTRRTRRRVTGRVALALVATGLLVIGPSAALAIPAASAAPSGTGTHNSMQGDTHMCASMNAPWI